jgi:hypothetical protein
MKRIFAACGLAIFSLHSAQSNPSSTLVISQIYGDGGTTGSSYANDFIEIYNRGSSGVNLSNFSVQYASGTTWTMTLLTAVILQPGEYYLVKEASNGSGGIQLQAADVTGTISMHSNMGKVALVNSTSLLPNGCLSASIVDLVGYGNATCYEGAAATSGSNTLSMIRKTGNADSDNNGADFTTSTPIPRTSSFTLPISINNFSINKTGKGNNLYWQLNCTASSITFELQRSPEGLNFEAIYTETASQSRCAAAFTYTDNRPLTTNYYRLKMLDADRHTSYSKIIFMSNDISRMPVLYLYPTSVRREATIKYLSPVSQNIQWVITNTEGKVVKKFTGNVIKGDNNIPLDVSNLIHAHYHLRGYTVGGATDVLKFVKE